MLTISTSAKPAPSEGFHWTGPLHKLLWPNPDRKINSVQDLLGTAKYKIPIYPLEPCLDQSTEPFDWNPPTPLHSIEIDATILDLHMHPDFRDGQDYLPCRSVKLLIIDDYTTMWAKLKETDDEYKIQFQLETGNPDKGRASVILGSPGIGKTCSLSYYLVLRLCLGLETVYVSNGGSYYWFLANGVRSFTNFHEFNMPFLKAHPLTLTPQVRNAWILYDSIQPEIESRFWRAHGIVASSSRTEAYKKWVKEEKGEVWIVDVWKWEEIAMLGIMSKANDLYPYWVIFNRFGHLPRLVSYLAPTSWKFSERFRNTNKTILTNAREFAMHDWRTAPPNYMKPDEPHNIVSMHPEYLPESKLTPEDKRPPFYTDHSARGVTEPSTMYIRIAIANFFLDVMRSKAYDYFTKLLEEPMTRTAAGTAFELMMHDIFQHGYIKDVQHSLKSLEPRVRMPCSLKHKLANVDRMRTSYHFRTDEELMQYINTNAPSLDMQNEISKTEGNKQGIYIRPILKNFPSIDSFYVRCAAPSLGYTPVLFQMTVGEDHLTSADGLQRIWNALPQKMTERGGYLVFITLHEPRKPPFAKQSIKPSSIKAKWWTVLHQMQLQVDGQKLLGFWQKMGEYASDEEATDETPDRVDESQS